MKIVEFIIRKIEESISKVAEIINRYFDIFTIIAIIIGFSPIIIMIIERIINYGK